MPSHLRASSFFRTGGTLTPAKLALVLADVERAAFIAGCTLDAGEHKRNFAGIAYLVYGSYSCFVFEVCLTGLTELAAQALDTRTDAYSGRACAVGQAGRQLGSQATCCQA